VSVFTLALGSLLQAAGTSTSATQVLTIRLDDMRPMTAQEYRDFLRGR
jgi:hypothetical protein